MIKNFFLILLSLVYVGVSKSQDTISVMNYNLLYYGYYTDFCTIDNNNVDIKAQNLHTIINYFRPDVFTVCELGRNASTADHLLNNALNKNEIDFYARAAYTNTANSSIVNMLYYNTNKFGLVSQAIPSNILRDINLYKLYYKAEDLAQTNDTIFLVCIVAHLKAGSTADDQQVRTNMINSMMTYIDYFNYRGNIMFMGDYNMNSSYETAYQQLLYYTNNSDIRFNDPINKPGQWYNNSSMAMYHTQSTRSGSASCFVTGGLDDRYDLILVSKDLLSGNRGFKYIPDSYIAIGQDGQRFNMSLIDPPNYSQPPEIINALYYFSDHLPVALKLEITDNQPTHISNNFVTKNYFRFNNPVRDALEIVINFDDFFKGKITILDLLGNKILSSDINEIHKLINVSDLNPGLYIILFEAENKIIHVDKFVKI